MSEKRLTIVIMVIQRYLNKYYSTSNIDYYDLFGIDKSLSKEDILKYLKENKYKACFHPDNINSLPEEYKPYYEEVCKLYVIFEDIVNNKKDYQHKSNQSKEQHYSYTSTNRSSYDYDDGAEIHYDDYQYQRSYNYAPFNINNWANYKRNEFIPNEIIAKWAQEWKEKKGIDSSILRDSFRGEYYTSNPFYNAVCEAIRPTIYEYGLQTTFEGLKNYYHAITSAATFEEEETSIKNVAWEKFTPNNSSRFKMQALDIVTFENMMRDISRYYGFSIEEIFNYIIFGILTEQEELLKNGLKNIQIINPYVNISEYLKQNVNPSEYLFIINYALGNIRYLIKPENFIITQNDIDIIITEYLKRKGLNTYQNEYYRGNYHSNDHGYGM